MSKKRTITFGNIIMTLLTLGTIAVAVLMFMVYQEVVKTPEVTATNYQKNNAAASTPIQIISPDNKTIGVTYKLETLSNPNKSATNEVQAASDVAMDDISSAIPKSVAPRKTTAVRKPTTQKVETDLYGTTLQPIETQQAERPLSPTNRINEQPARERVLDPISPQQNTNSNSNDAINELM